MRKEDVVTLQRIVNQIVKTGHRVLAQNAIPAVLFFEMNFPILPLNTKYVVPHINNKPLPAGLFFLAGALVIFKVLNPPAVEFKAPPPVKIPKMRLKKLMPKLKKPSKPRSAAKIVAIVEKVEREHAGAKADAARLEFVMDRSDGDFYSQGVRYNMDRESIDYAMEERES